MSGRCGRVPRRRPRGVGGPFALPAAGPGPPARRCRPLRAGQHPEGVRAHQTQQLEGVLEGFGVLVVPDGDAHPDQPAREHHPPLPGPAEGGQRVQDDEPAVHQVGRRRVVHRLRGRGRRHGAGGREGRRAPPHQRHAVAARAASPARTAGRRPRRGTSTEGRRRTAPAWRRPRPRRTGSWCAAAHEGRERGPCGHGRLLGTRAVPVSRASRGRVLTGARDIRPRPAGPRRVPPQGPGHPPSRRPHRGDQRRHLYPAQGTTTETAAVTVPSGPRTGAATDRASSVIRVAHRDPGPPHLGRHPARARRVGERVSAPTSRCAVVRLSPARRPMSVRHSAGCSWSNAASTAGSRSAAVGTSPRGPGRGRAWGRPRAGRAGGGRGRGVRGADVTARAPPGTGRGIVSGGGRPPGHGGGAASRAEGTGPAGPGTGVVRSAGCRAGRAMIGAGRKVRPATEGYGREADDSGGGGFRCRSCTGRSSGTARRDA